MRLRAIDLRTGRVRWSTVTDISFCDGPSPLALLPLAESGTVAVTDEDRIAAFASSRPRPWDPANSPFDLSSRRVAVAQATAKAGQGQPPTAITGVAPEVEVGPGYVVVSVLTTTEENNQVFAVSLGGK